MSYLARSIFGPSASKNDELLPIYEPRETDFWGREIKTVPTPGSHLNQTNWVDPSPFNGNAGQTPSELGQRTLDTHNEWPLGAEAFVPKPNYEFDAPETQTPGQGDFKEDDWVLVPTPTGDEDSPPTTEQLFAQHNLMSLTDVWDFKKKYRADQYYKITLDYSAYKYSDPEFLDALSCSKKVEITMVVKTRQLPFFNMDIFLNLKMKELQFTGGVMGRLKLTGDFSQESLRYDKLYELPGFTGAIEVPDRKRRKLG